MPIIHNNSLPLLLHLLRPNLQTPHKTSILLPLRHNRNNLPFLQRLLLLGQPAPRRSQSGRHQRRAREHEADRAAVDLDRRERGGIRVDELEVRDWRAVLRLVEEGGGVYCVECGFFGSITGVWVSNAFLFFFSFFFSYIHRKLGGGAEQFDRIKLCLFRKNLIDKWFKARV